MFNIMNKKLGRKGFTLIELIVVIAIIAILAVILIPRFANFTDGAREKAAMSDVRNLLMIIQKVEAENKLTADAKVIKDITDADVGNTMDFAGEFDTDGYKVGSGGFTYIADATYSDNSPITIVVKDYQIPKPTK